MSLKVLRNQANLINKSRSPTALYSLDDLLTGGEKAFGDGTRKTLSGLTLSTRWFGRSGSIAISPSYFAFGPSF